MEERGAYGGPLWNAISSVYDRHDKHAPLNHVNVAEWVEAASAVADEEQAELRAEVERLTEDEMERPDWDDKVAKAQMLEHAWDRVEEAEAEVERLRGEVAHWEHHAWEAGEGFKRAIEDGVRAGSRRRETQARLDALVADLRGLAGDWNRLMGWPRNVGAPALAFVLDKHAGEQAQGGECRG